MKRLCIILFLLLEALISTSSALATPDRVGVTVPMTGDYAAAGREIRRGMQLAAALPEAEGLQVLYEDDHSFQLKESVNAVNALLNLHKVSVILHTTGDTVSAVAPLWNRARVPGIVVWDSVDEPNDLGLYTFAFGFSAPLAGAQMGKFARDRLSLDSAAIVKAPIKWAEGISAGFSQEFLRRGGKIALDERIDSETPDFRAMILRLKRQNVQAVYIPLYNVPLSSFVKQSLELNYHPKFLAGGSMTPEDIVRMGSSAEGIIATNSWFEDSDLNRRYRSMFGESKDPIQFSYVGMGYDALRYIVTLRQHLQAQSKPFNSDTVYEAMRHTRYEGLTGIVEFGGRQVSPKTERILIVRGGKLELYQ